MSLLHRRPLRRRRVPKRIRSHTCDPQHPSHIRSLHEIGVQAEMEDKENIRHLPVFQACRPQSGLFVVYDDLRRVTNKRRETHEGFPRAPSQSPQPSSTAARCPFTEPRQTSHTSTKAAPPPPTKYTAGRDTIRLSMAV